MPTPGLKKTFAKVYLGNDARRRYEVRKGDSGWLFYEPVAQLLKDRAALSSMIPAGETLQYGDEAVSGVITIDREHLKGVILRPLDVYLTPDEVKAAFDFTPDVEEWDLQPSADGLHTEMIAPDSGPDAAPDTKHVQPLDFFCPNGWFTVGFKSQATPGEKVQDMKAADDYADAAYCMVTFGGGISGPQWCLRIPMKGKPTLYEYRPYWDPPAGWIGYWPSQWVPRPWTEGELGEVNPSSLSGQGKLYRIGVIGHAICVSESNFDDSFAYYVVADRAQPVVAPGTITASSWPGQCVLRLSPLMFRPARVWRYPFWVEDWRYGVDFEALLWGEQYTTGCNGGGQFFAIGEAEGYPGYLTWSTEILPIAFQGYHPSSDSSGSTNVFRLWSYSTPFVESFTLMQAPVITDNGEPEWIERLLIPDLSASDALAESGAQRFQLAVDNRLAMAKVGQSSSSSSSESSGPDRILPPTVDFRPGRFVKLETGREYTDDTVLTAPLGQHVIVAAPRTAEICDCELTDLLGMLALTKWRHGQLCLKGLNAKAAFEFLLKLEGIGEDWYDIEDVGTALWAGLNPNNESWSYDEGTVVAEILADIAKYGMHNAVVYYDPSVGRIRTGCRFCRAKRTTETWASHQDNGWASSGCLAADMVRNGSGFDLVVVAGDYGVDAEHAASLNVCTDLQTEECVLGGDEYANLVQVSGEAADGRQIALAYRHDEAVFSGAGMDDEYSQWGREYVGWQIGRREQVKAGATYADLGARLAEIAAESVPWAMFVRRCTIPGNHTVRVGQAMQVQGGHACDAHERSFRITSVRQNLRAQTTSIEAREMAGLPVVSSSSSSSASSEGSE